MPAASLARSWLLQEVGSQPRATLLSVGLSCGSGLCFHLARVPVALLESSCLYVEVCLPPGHAGTFSW